jgi:hypothetical protein
MIAFSVAAFPNPSPFLSSSPISGGLNIESDSQENSYENEESLIAQVYRHVRKCGKQGCTMQQVVFALKQSGDYIRQSLEDLLDDKKVWKYHEKLADWYTTVEPNEAPKERGPDPRFRSKQLSDMGDAPKFSRDNDSEAECPFCEYVARGKAPYAVRVRISKHLQTNHNMSQEEARKKLIEIGIIIEGSDEVKAAEDFENLNKPVAEAPAPVAEVVQELPKKTKKNKPLIECTNCHKMVKGLKRHLQMSNCGNVRPVAEQEVKEVLQPNGEAKMTPLSTLNQAKRNEVVLEGLMPFVCIGSMALAETIAIPLEDVNAALSSLEKMGLAHIHPDSSGDLWASGPARDLSQALDKMGGAIECPDHVGDPTLLITSYSITEETMSAAEAATEEQVTKTPRHIRHAEISYALEGAQYREDAALASINTFWGTIDDARRESLWNDTARRILRDHATASRERSEYEVILGRMNAEGVL